MVPSCVVTMGFEPSAVTVVPSHQEQIPWLLEEDMTAAEHAEFTAWFRRVTQGLLGGGKGWACVRPCPIVSRGCWQSPCALDHKAARWGWDVTAAPVL